jgi:hypothetical protein
MWCSAKVHFKASMLKFDVRNAAQNSGNAAQNSTNLAQNFVMTLLPNAFVAGQLHVPPVICLHRMRQEWW